MLEGGISIETAVLENAVASVLLPWVRGQCSTGGHWGPHRVLPLILTAACDEVTWPGGRKVGSEVTWDSPPTHFTSQQMALTFCQREALNKTLLGKFQGQRDMYQGSEHRNSLGVYLSSLKKSPLLSSSCSLALEEKEAGVSLTVYSLPLLISTHMNLHVKITLLGSQIDVCMCKERGLSLSEAQEDIAIKK